MSDAAGTPVIVLNWNGWEDTFACLRSLREHGAGCPVWLIDNASRADRRAEAATLYPGLRAFRWDDNYGWAGGYNRALRIALREGYDYVYLLNNDCLVTPGFLQAVVDVAREDPAAAVGSYLAYAAAPEWLQFDGVPRPEGERAVADGLCTRRTRRLSGAGMLVRMRALAGCGLFDERLFCYWDDTEWCARVREAGWHLLIAGGSLLLHRGNGSDVNFNALYYLHRNRYLVRARADLRFPPIRELRYVCGGLRFAGELYGAGRKEEAKAIVAGLWDGWTGRTGRRGSEPPAPILSLLLHLWPRPPASSSGCRAGRRLKGGVVHDRGGGERRTPLLDYPRRPGGCRCRPCGLPPWPPGGATLRSRREPPYAPVGATLRPGRGLRRLARSDVPYRVSRPDAHE